MSRRILSVVLAIVLISGGAIIAKADVTGSLDVHIALIPEGTQTESVKFFIDLQSNLNVNVTLSGLTFGADVGFGTTGIEFAILSLSTNLGALSVFDEFVFATPFGCYADFVDSNGNGEADAWDYDFDGVGDSTGQCAGQYVVAVGDVSFAKKRITSELNIAGITLTTLALFEDVDFPDIQGGEDHEHDHYCAEDFGSFGAGFNCIWPDSKLVFGEESTGATSGTLNIPGLDKYWVGQTNSVVDDQTPTYGFGAVISVTGQTVSGITISGSTALCASARNYIKKRSWLYEVNRACTAAFGIKDALGLPSKDDAELVELEGGAKTPLLFEEETLNIQGVEVGGVGIDVFTAWHPNDANGFSTTIEASFSLLDLADMTVVLSSNNITSLSIDDIVATITSGNLHVTLTDSGGDLSIDKTVAVLSVVLNANQNPADLTVSVTTEDGVGLTSAKLSLGISRGPFNVDTTTVFAGAGTLNWVSTTFSVSVDGLSGIAFAADIDYSPDGMGAIGIQLGFVF